MPPEGALRLRPGPSTSSGQAKAGSAALLVKIEALAQAACDKLLSCPNPITLTPLS
jgi:hypothetical protein